MTKKDPVKEIVDILNDAFGEGSAVAIEDLSSLKGADPQEIVNALLEKNQYIRNGGLLH